MALPLASCAVLDTRDLDEARESIGREMCPHGLWPMGDTRSFHARLHVGRLGGVRLQYLAYGARVRLSHEHAQDTYLALLPIRGATEISDGRDRVAAAGSTAAMLCPRTRLDKDLSAGSSRLVVRLDRTTVETTLSRLLGRPLQHPLRFDLRLDLAGPRGQVLSGLVDLVRRDLEQDARLLSHPLTERPVQQLLVTELLLAAAHNYTGHLHDAPARACPPPRVRRAVELIHEHAGEPLTVDDIATAVGVGVRSLQQGFREHLHTTPMAYLQRVRLQRAHADLSAAPGDGTTSVTDIAYRWGFTHPGRFAQTYRRIYGQPPSATLRG